MSSIIYNCLLDNSKYSRTENVVLMNNCFLLSIAMLEVEMKNVNPLLRK